MTDASADRFRSMADRVREALSACGYRRCRLCGLHH
ncbi:hypothetical protein IFT37_09725 [Pseudomonas fluorescens]|uniref:Protein-PII uridylyltransferase N-terminal domain-containing protein n=1 Tax=Pseudomonas azadiae TaxID=2843612 RepID=A0ABS6P3T3_9PSED|nr:hypothetical protein [Pseudomonas fluorescens]MBV4455110.1 hypothetical protein [Pseudomonas azadiae]NMF38883.1 hypothetical protein [Pseudomonas sp. SWRI 103]NMX59074.1 hypothetical protein [Pseudomonas sp. WS 5146]MBD8176514.1 hypothetical protein [Pseudomonas fluorescens]